MSRSLKTGASAAAPTQMRPMTSGCASSITSSATSTATGAQKYQIKESCIKHKPKLKASLTRMVYDWEWEVPNFEMAFPPSAIPVKSSNHIISTLRSEKVEIGEEIDKKSVWQFQVSTLGGWLRWHFCILKISKSSIVPIYFTYELKLVDRSGKELLSCKSDATASSGDGEFGWDNLIELDKFWEQKDSFLQDNKLRAQVVLELLRDHSKSVDVQLKQKLSEFSLLMTHDMVKLRDTENTADVTIECKGKLFPAHRLILSARSTAFAHMFENQLCKSQSQSNNLVLTDVEAFILDALLEYIYTGVVSVKYIQNNEMLSGLIQAADKYQLHQLKSFCFSAMAKSITPETVGDLAVLAHRHHADRSVKRQIEQFCRGNVEGLLKLKSFRNALKQEPDAFYNDDHAGGDLP